MLMTFSVGCAAAGSIVHSVYACDVKCRLILGKQELGPIL